MDRAFSNVQIKAVSEDRREFEGWASTPTTDRQNDQLMPERAKFELPLPFLLDHDHTKVVGEVYKAEVSKRGIRFWGRIQKIAEPGAVKDLVDYAWQLIKNKLLLRFCRHSAKSCHGKNITNPITPAIQNPSRGVHAICSMRRIATA